MPNVVEDVTEVVLNLKGVRIKMNTANPVQAKIHVKGKRDQDCRCNCSRYPDCW